MILKKKKFLFLILRTKIILKTNVMFGTIYIYNKIKIRHFKKSIFIKHLLVFFKKKNENREDGPFFFSFQHENTLINDK